MKEGGKGLLYVMLYYVLWIYRSSHRTRDELPSPPGYVTRLAETEVRMFT